MLRRVLYDPGAWSAAAAATLLAGDFDVRPLPDGHPADASVVILVGADWTSAAAPNERVIGLVDLREPRPWPDAWHALLPEHPGGPALGKAVRNAFADLEAAADRGRLERELSELNAIGIRLSSERDPHVLLELILHKAREITHSDAGSLYLIEDDDRDGRRLRFALAQNDSLAVPFETTTLPLSCESLAGWVALEGASLHLDDAYAPPADAPFRINRSFDERTGYRTKSMLVVPMRTPQGETIGVLQLINCKPRFSMTLASRAATERVVQPFSARFVALASSLASQAAVALQNSRLYESIQRLFDGFVQASVVAIESRDPTTAGHSFRVAELAVGLAEAADRTVQGAYAALTFTASDLMELRYASLLHDFGKVGVREHVLQKAKKLSPEALERILGRVEALRRGLEIASTRRKLALVLDKGVQDYHAQAPSLDAELEAALADLDLSLSRVLAANEPTVLPHDTRQEIRRLAAARIDDPHDGPVPILTAAEAEILAIPRGSLTPEEFDEIRSHVVHSWEFLVRILWTREFRRIPEIARSHHEKLDGSGYPGRLRADEIPVQSRIMTIADIYDALTAFDRPYKPSVSPEKALDILRDEQRLGLIDGDLLDLFIGAGIWQRRSV
ncbi:MAG: GAF domain-containing protein [Candidatus Rokubacteria bacterium]|nr:GAF domain-containing protein [Candidatus Rokubacteria bacterium]